MSAGRRFDLPDQAYDLWINWALGLHQLITSGCHSVVFGRHLSRDTAWIVLTLEDARQLRQGPANAGP